MTDLEKKIQQAELEAHRAQAVIDCMNLMSSYTHHHPSQTHYSLTKRFELFAKHTPGTMLYVIGWGLWTENNGLKRVFLDWWRDTIDVQYKYVLNRHDISSWAIEVAKDGKTAKGVFGTLGPETKVNPNCDDSEIGSKDQRVSTWVLGTYDAAFVLEDGEWKIWKLAFRSTFMTAFDSAGWTVKQLGYPTRGNVMKPEFRPDVPITTRGGVFRRNGRPSFVAACIPAPPKPYDTWDDSMFDPYKDPFDVDLIYPQQAK